jgi:HK97 family phage major capsid protein
MKIKLLKNWMGHAAGSVIEVDADTAKSIIAEGSGAEYDAASEGAAKKSADEQTAAIKSAVEGALPEIVKNALAAEGTSAKRFVDIRVTDVHDKSDDDPLAGYLGEHSKSAKDITPEEVHYAFGKFASDVQNVQNKGASKLLQDQRERSQKMISKAAGDGMVVGSDADGGYLIPAAAASMIQAASLEASIIRPRASRMTLGTQALDIPYLQDQTHTTGSVYGGISVYFDDELEQSTSSKPKLGKIALRLKKMTALGYASEEFVKWSPVSLGSWLLPRFGEAIGWKEDLVFINGKGGGQPLGILNSPAAVEVAKEGSQAANTLVLANTTKMFARLRARRSGSIAWLMSQTVFPQLPLLNVAVGTGGSAVFVNSATGALSQSLWGHPIQYSEKVPVLGDAKDVSLVDISDYIVADDQSGPSVAQSIHLKFDYGQTAFRITKYVDGQSMTKDALAPFKAGSTTPDTLSPVVTLAERA